MDNYSPEEAVAALDELGLLEDYCQKRWANRPDLLIECGYIPRKNYIKLVVDNSKEDV